VGLLALLAVRREGSNRTTCRRSRGEQVGRWGRVWLNDLHMFLEVMFFTADQHIVREWLEAPCKQTPAVGSGTWRWRQRFPLL